MLIGIVDDGIDVLHTAFRAADDSTRIAALWDQTQDSAGGADGAPFGTVYTAAEINGFIAANSAPRSLASAHGTRVASIAAGRRADTAASQTEAFQGGVAPEAKIVFVKLNSSLSVDAAPGAAMSNLLALDFVAQTAQKLGLPYVANLSFGTNVGAHDGTAMLESHIERLCELGMKPGACFVKSAGNEQVSASQATLELGPGDTGEFIWNARTIDRTSDVVDIWFKSGDRFSFRLHQPDDIGAGASGVLSIGNRFVETEFPNGNQVRMIYDPLRSENGDARVTVQVFPGSADKIQGGDWRLEVSASTHVPAGGRLHAWIERDDKRPVKFKDQQSGTGRITIPGTARSVITVGAVQSEPSLKAWKSSSRGPTRDGRFKPELSAPGANVRSALFGTRDRAGPKSGTSFAAPHVTGAIGLLLSYRERNNLIAFNSLQLQALLTQHCTGYDGKWRDNKGYGVLNISNVFKNLDGV